MSGYQTVKIRDDISRYEGRAGAEIPRTGAVKVVLGSKTYTFYDWRGYKAWVAKRESGNDYLVPMVTVFNGEDSLVEKIKISLNEQETQLDSTPRYHVESAFRKYVTLNPDQETLCSNYEVDDNLKKTVVGWADDSSWGGLINIASGDPHKTWFTDVIRRRLMTHPMDGITVTDFESYWIPQHRLFTDTRKQWFPNCRLRMEVKFLDDLKFCVQRNPYTNILLADTTTNGVKLRDSDYQLKFTYKFDALVFNACVLDAPKEVVRVGLEEIQVFYW